MFGKNMMNKLQEMQKQVEETKERLHTIRISDESNGVRVEVTGNGLVADITGGDGMETEELLDNVIIAANKALAQAEKTKELEMAQSAKGFLPGM